MCEQLRKREVYLFFQQKIRWRGHGARFVGCRGRRYKLWWSGNRRCWNFSEGSNLKSGDEPLSRGKNESSSGICVVILGILGMVQVGLHQRSVLSPLLFAIAMDVISENAREGLMNEILYADDLVLMRVKV